jgi:hypothetical protein
VSALLRYSMTFTSPFMAGVLLLASQPTMRRAGDELQGRRAKNRRFLRLCECFAGSGDERGLAVQVPFFGQQEIRVLKALAALRHLAERCIDGFRVAIAQPGRAAELAFPDGIADADVHGRLQPGESLSNANRLQ